MEGGSVDARLSMLRICGLADALVTTSDTMLERYSSFISSLQASGAAEAVGRLRKVVMWIELMRGLGIRIRERVCSTGSFAALYDVYNDFERYYARVVAESALIPAGLRHLYYEIYAMLRSAVNPVPIGI